MDGEFGFPGFVDQLAAFPQPLVCALNGLALGIGATMLGFEDLVLMSNDARVRCPFTDLAVAPEAASSYTFPLLLGRQAASWLLMRSEWFDAEECLRMGLAWRVTTPDELLDVTFSVAEHLAAKPIESLVETKRAITASHRDLITAARRREDGAFVRLMGRPANLEAFALIGATLLRPVFGKRRGVCHRAIAAADYEVDRIGPAVVVAPGVKTPCGGGLSSQSGAKDRSSNLSCSTLRNKDLLVSQRVYLVEEANSLWLASHALIMDGIIIFRAVFPPAPSGQSRNQLAMLITFREGRNRRRLVAL